MGLHTGQAIERDGDYFGPAVIRAARLMSVVGGRRIACSRATAELVAHSVENDGVELVPIGTVRLKGLSAPELVFAVRGRGLAEDGSSLPSGAAMHVLGTFELRLPDGRTAGPWNPPTSRRLLQLLAIRPGHHIRRDDVSEVFFAGQTASRAGTSIARALAGIRRATSPFEVVRADRSMIALEPAVVVDVDTAVADLASALDDVAGGRRDAALVHAGADGRRLLEDELHAPWSIGPRDELDRLRAQARITLARDRANGCGRHEPSDVAAAWQRVLLHDPANEEACLGAMHVLLSVGDRAGALDVQRRTCSALSDLGLDPSRALDEAAAELGATDGIVPYGAGPLTSAAEIVRARVLAATNARRRLASRAARTLFDQAVEAADTLVPLPDELHPVVFDALVQLGELLRDADDDTGALVQFERAAQLARGDAESARAWSALASIPYRHGDMEGAIALYRSGLDALRGTEPLARVALLTDLGFALGRLGREDESLVTLELACASLDTWDDPRLAGRTLDHYAVALRSAGRLGDAITAMQRAMNAVGPLADESVLIPLYVHRAGILDEVGRGGEALADLSAAARMASTSGEHYALAVVHWVKATIHERREEIDLALAERDAEVALLGTIGNARNMAHAEAARARLLERLARPHDAEVAADRARAAARSLDDADLSSEIERLLSG
jgi:DNA-binding SARP family transcriptional activator